MAKTTPEITQRIVELTKQGLTAQETVSVLSREGIQADIHKVYDTRYYYNKKKKVEGADLFMQWLNASTDSVQKIPHNNTRTSVKEPIFEMGGDNNNCSSECLNCKRLKREIEYLKGLLKLSNYFNNED